MSQFTLDVANYYPLRHLAVAFCDVSLTFPWFYRVMKILASHNHADLGNRAGVSRRDRYKGQVKITEKDRLDQLDIVWDPKQVPAKDGGVVGDKHVIKNFRWGFQESAALPADWQPNFSDTTVDTSKVKDVYFVLQPFKPEAVAAHALMVFEMEDDTAIVGAEGQKDVGLALSVEARSPQGEGYNLVKGLSKHFGQLYQLGSLVDQLQKVSRQRGHKLAMHKLDLSHEQKKELLENALSSATQDRLGEWYHLITNSCITSAYDTLNQVLPVDQKLARWTQALKLPRPATFLPVIAGATLRQKNLLTNDPVTIINPDPKIFPEIQHNVSRLNEVLGPASRSALWNPGFRLAGGAIGGSLGYAIGSAFGGIPALAGLAGGALAGQYLGDRTADLVGVKNDITVMPATQWYANHAGVTLEQAQTKIADPALAF